MASVNKQEILTKLSLISFGSLLHRGVNRVGFYPNPTRKNKVWVHIFEDPNGFGF